MRDSLRFPGSTAFFFGGDILDHPGWTQRARSNLVLGGPLSSFTDASPKRDSAQQQEHYQPLWAKVQKDVFAHFGVEDYNGEFSQDGLEVLLWGGAMGMNEFDDTVSGDLVYSLGSILIVMCFLVRHSTPSRGLAPSCASWSVALRHAAWTGPLVDACFARCPRRLNI